MPTTLGTRTLEGGPRGDSGIALQELEQLRTDLLSTIAHELRTPLTAVRTSVGLLLDPSSEPTDEQQATLLTAIERNADRMQRLVGDILELSRFRAGSVQLQLRRFRAIALAEAASGLVAPLATSAGQRIAIDVAVPVGHQVFGDRRRLEQALVNLARERPALFAARGRRPPAGRAARGQTAWVVEDDGPGIPEADRARLFERFFVGRNDQTGPRDGVGLGLPTALAIAQAHGGTIEVDSTVGRGSTVRARRAHRRARGGRAVMRILVVDDEPDVVESIRLGFALQWREVEVLGAATGDEALDIVERESPDLVLLDIGLPGHRRLRRPARAARVLRRAGRDADGPRRRDGQGEGSGARRRRLRHQAVQPPRADGARAGRAPPPRHAGPGEPRARRSGRATSRSTSRARRSGSRGERVDLTPTEYKLLYHLVRNAGHVLQHGTLLAKVWGREYVDETDYVRVYIRRLRDKLGDDPDNPRYIQTERRPRATASCCHPRRRAAADRLRRSAGRRRRAVRRAGRDARGVGVLVRVRDVAQAEVILAAGQHPAGVARVAAHRAAGRGTLERGRVGVGLLVRGLVDRLTGRRVGHHRPGIVARRLLRHRHRAVTSAAIVVDGVCAGVARSAARRRVTNADQRARSVLPAARCRARRSAPCSARSAAVTSVAPLSPTLPVAAIRATASTSALSFFVYTRPRPISRANVAHRALDLERVPDPRPAGRRRLDLVHVDDRHARRPDDELERAIRHQPPDQARVDLAVARPDVDRAALDERPVGPGPGRVVAPLAPRRGIGVQREHRGGLDRRLATASIDQLMRA